MFLQKDSMRANAKGIQYSFKMGMENKLPCFSRYCVLTQQRQALSVPWKQPQQAPGHHGHELVLQKRRSSWDRLWLGQRAWTDSRCSFWCFPTLARRSRNTGWKGEADFSPELQMSSRLPNDSYTQPIRPPLWQLHCQGPLDPKYWWFSN